MGGAGLAQGVLRGDRLGHPRDLLLDVGRADLEADPELLEDRAALW